MALIGSGDQEVEVKKTIEELIAEDKLDESVQMFRRIREERDKRFGTLDALFDHLQAAERAMKREGKSRSVKTKPRRRADIRDDKSQTIRTTLRRGA